MTVKLSDTIARHNAILVIDDIPSARKITQRMLEGLGFTKIVQASSLEEAKKLISDTYLGMIISDVHLKDGKGTDVFTILKELERSVPVMMITSDMEATTFKEAVENGASHYLLKPFSAQHLAEKIEQVFST